MEAYIEFIGTPQKWLVLVGWGNSNGLRYQKHGLCPAAIVQAISMVLDGCLLLSTTHGLRSCFFFFFCVGLFVFVCGCLWLFVCLVVSLFVCLFACLFVLFLLLLGIVLLLLLFVWCFGCCLMLLCRASCRACIRADVFLQRPIEFLLEGRRVAFESSSG